ncbi:MAG: hypothetical protein ACRDCF_00340 [Mycoplasmoidaceae bacterium]
MSNKNINIVNRKKTNVNNKKMKDSLITMFLLPSSILTDQEDNVEKCENSYSFLENESNGVLYKFKKSIPYFEKLKKEFIDKKYIVESDDFFEINSVDLFALQTITEFLNNKFTYKTQKNYFKVLFEDTEYFELYEKITTLEKYIVALSDLFNIIESNLFDLSSAMTSSIDEYISKFEKDRLMISDLLFGRNIKLQDLIKKIKICSYETDKKLIEKIKKLELEYNNNGFLYKNDFLKFLFYTMEEIKNLFASIIVELIPAVDVLWKNYEIKMEEDRLVELKKQEEKERQKEANLVQKIKKIKIQEKSDVEKLRSISLPKNEIKKEMAFEESNSLGATLENDDILIEEYDFSNETHNSDSKSNYEEFIIPKNEEEVIEWDENNELTESKCNTSFEEEKLELDNDKWLNQVENKSFNNEEESKTEDILKLDDDNWLNEKDESESDDDNWLNEKDESESEDDKWLNQDDNLKSDDDNWLNEKDESESEDDKWLNQDDNLELEDDKSFNEEDLEFWNKNVDVNDDDFEFKSNETNENNFINETENLIYDTLINEISGLEDEEDSSLDDEEAITKNMDSLINEIKDSIEKEDNDSSSEEFEY